MLIQLKKKRNKRMHVNKTPPKSSSMGIYSTLINNKEIASGPRRITAFQKIWSVKIFVR